MMLKMAQKFDKNKMKKMLIEENEFVTNLLFTSDVPDVVDDDDNLYLKNVDKPIKGIPILKPTAETEEANEENIREIMQNKIKNKKNKLSERGMKKKEKKKLLKQKALKSNAINANKAMKNGLIKKEKLSEDVKEIAKPVKPIFNQEGKIVFSKFDFAANTSTKIKNKKDKIVKNPQIALQNLEKTKTDIKQLMSSGNKEKAFQLKTDMAWKKAFDKTEGKKIKDNPELLKRAIHKKEVQKRKSKKNWQERKKNVENKIDNKIKKRQENLNKKIQEKKSKKMKRLSKRGKVIPGF